MSSRNTRTTDLRSIRRLTSIILSPIIVGMFLAAHLLGAETVEDLVEEKYPINADAALSIRNTAGAIRVYGGNVSEITIKAVKRAFSADRLKQIVVEVKAAPEEVKVQTIMPPQKGSLSLEDRSGTVDYTIVVPNTIRIAQLNLANGEVLMEGLRGGSVTSHVGDGWLVARNSFGNMDLTIKNGRLLAIYDFWELFPFQAKLTSPEGDIRIYLPPEAPINIAARTTSGRILNWLGKEENDPRKPRRVLDFAVGSAPSAKFEMSSESGDIRISKAY